MAQLPVPQPTQQQVAPEAQMEALRRRAQLGDSSATIGADVANSPSPENPIAQVPQPGQPGGGGAAGAPTAGATTGLGQQKGEAEKIISALAARLKALGDQGK